jgi:hypothetical protein|tara:strand:+ start:133 stop:492 length:360 start_codon:yes stop_codon:yes gene_type:complete
MTTPNFGESYRNQFMEPRFQNPFLDYLEGSTEGQFGIFQSVAQPFATERRKRETISNVFQQARNEFLGEIAGAARRGETPTTTFTQFLEQFPVSARIQQQAGSPFTRSLAPPTRFLYGF